MWVWPQLVFGGSPPIPHCDWRTLPSSQTPSLLALSFPLPPTPLGSFCKALGGGGPGRRGGRGPRAQGGGGGGASKRHLGPDPHLGVLEEFSPRTEILSVVFFIRDGEALKGLFLKGFLSKHRSIACPLPLALASDLPCGVCTCKWDLQLLSPGLLWTDFPRRRGWRVTTALGNPFSCRTALGNPFPCRNVCFAQKAPLDKPPLRLPDGRVPWVNKSLPGLSQIFRAILFLCFLLSTRERAQTENKNTYLTPPNSKRIPPHAYV